MDLSSTHTGYLKSGYHSVRTGFEFGPLGHQTRHTQRIAELLSVEGTGDTRLTIVTESSNQ